MYVSQDLDTAEQALCRAARALEPERLLPRDAVRLMQQAARVERRAAALKALCAGRVAETNAWTGNGARSAAHHLARQTGTSLKDAERLLDAVEQMKDLPATEATFKEGKLSEDQVAAVADAATADPSAEADLLDTAATDTLGGLRMKARRVKATAPGRDEAERLRRLHDERSVRRWTDDDGFYRLDAKLPPNRGAQLHAVLESYFKEVLAEARAQDRREPYEAYAADALVRMAEAAAGRREKAKVPAGAAVNVVVDAEALLRGRGEAGERCYIDGVGDVPVAVATSFLGEALLNVVIAKGVAVRNVTHAGRYRSAHMETALMVENPECCIEGCHVVVGLEFDHDPEFRYTKHTRITEGARPCGYHHDLKTYKGYTFGPGPGKRKLIPPGGTDPPEEGEAAVAAEPNPKVQELFAAVRDAVDACDVEGLGRRRRTRTG